MHEKQLDGEAWPSDTRRHRFVFSYLKGFRGFAMGLLSKVKLSFAFQGEKKKVKVKRTKFQGENKEISGPGALRSPL